MTSRALLDALRPLVAELVNAELAKRGPAAPPPRLLSTRAAADVAGVRQETIRRWIAEGKLSKRRSGRHIRVIRSELEALLRSPRARNGNVSPEDRAGQDFE